MTEKKKEDKSVWPLFEKAILRACERMDSDMANMVEDAIVENKKKRESKK